MYCIHVSLVCGRWNKERDIYCMRMYCRAYSVIIIIFLMYILMGNKMNFLSAIACSPVQVRVLIDGGNGVFWRNWTILGVWSLLQCDNCVPRLGSHLFCEQRPAVTVRYLFCFHPVLQCERTLDIPLLYVCLSNRYYISPHIQISALSD